MIRRIGSVATSALLGIASVAMIGTAGYMAVTGNTVCSLVGGSCETACSSEATNDVTAQNILASSSTTESKSCCPLGSLAKGADVVPASTKAECASSCSDKAACGSKNVDVIAASTKTECASSCSDKAACGSKNVDVIAASTKTECASSCSDKAACGSKNVDVVAASTKSQCASSCSDKAVDVVAASTMTNCASDCTSACNSKAVDVMAASTSDCGASCSEMAACGDSNVYNTRMASILAAFNASSASKAACSSSCTEMASCGDKSQITSVAAKQEASCSSSCSERAACSESNTVMASAKADCCPVLASKGVAHMAAATSPVFVPAAFFSAASIDMSNLTEAGCCRSAAENCSAASSCGDAEKACCSKGEKTVASN